jgi:3-hydroxyisobutyrate dehydrogenase-like beta-hydroxyacid dehydrogenase
MNVGLIGAGIMGQPMARNLARAGNKVFIHSRTRSRVDALLAEGFVWCDSPAEVARSVAAIISIVPDSPDVRSVYLGSSGVCEELRAGTLCIDMSTIDPAVAREVADRVRQGGGKFLDAPVSGGKTGAEAGTLTIMVGGDENHLNEAMPLFEAIGKNVVHCGPIGNGQLTKLCNQILCGLNLLAVCEAFVFARKVGLDPMVMHKAVSTGAAGSWALQNLGQRMLDRDFAPMIMIDLQQKDLGIALTQAMRHAVSMPGTALVRELLAAAQAAGEGREGTQALVKTLERLAALGP